MSVVMVVATPQKPWLTSEGEPGRRGGDVNSPRDPIGGFHV